MTGTCQITIILPWGEGGREFHLLLVSSGWPFRRQEGEFLLPAPSPTAPTTSESIWLSFPANGQSGQMQSRGGGCR